jgi:hypothetical protein
VGEERKETKSVRGLFPGHAYPVLDYSPKDYKEGDVCWVQLRNPWGEIGRKYIGSEDQEITEPQREKWTGKPKGTREETEAATFWLELSDLTKRFDVRYVGTS